MLWEDLAHWWCCYPWVGGPGRCTESQLSVAWASQSAALLYGLHCSPCPGCLWRWTLPLGCNKNLFLSAVVWSELSHSNRKQTEALPASTSCCPTCVCALKAGFESLWTHLPALLCILTVPLPSPPLTLSSFTASFFGDWILSTFKIFPLSCLLHFLYVPQMI